MEMEEADKLKAAFVYPLGLWEFNQMPQGITNAPSTFQWLMERCMGDLNQKDALVSIDNLSHFNTCVSFDFCSSRVLEKTNSLD